jgi:hypothetical protein
MNRQDIVLFSLGQRVTLAATVAFALFLLSPGHGSYPDLHTGLDIGMSILSLVLALSFWDTGTRLGQVVPRLIGVSFAVTTLFDAVHAFCGVEWSGPLEFIRQTSDTLRPWTWPPASHVLPIGFACVVWLRRHDAQVAPRMAAALLLIGAALLALFGWLPRYTPPGWLGISRPALVCAPLLWIFIAGWRAWPCSRPSWSSPTP